MKPTVECIPSALTRRQIIMGSALSLSVGNARRAFALDSADRVTRAAEAIHQEPSFNAQRHRLYHALTDAKQFDKLMTFSGAIKSMAVERKPVTINAHAGGTFSLFGDYISGRFIELIPDGLIVQAWRVGSWGQGIYSVARFELHDEGEGSKIVFDHTGFPVGQADHLSEGWYANYWDPLRKLLT